MLPNLALVPMQPVLEGEIVDAVSPSPLSDLDAREQDLAGALVKSEMYQWQAALILHDDIYKTGLWRSAFDDDGRPFGDFERYIISLRQRIPRLGVRWAQQHISTISLFDALGVTREKLTRCSPTELMAIRKLVQYDHRKGEVKGYNADDGADLVLSLVEDAATPGVLPSDIKKQVQAALKRPTVSYAWHGEGLPLPSMGPSYDIVVYHDDLAYNANIQFMYTGIPERIIDDLKKRLGCPG